VFVLALVAVLAAQPADAEGPITAAAIARDGKHVVLGSQSGIEVRSWPELTVTGTVQVDLPHIHDLEFSPDGRTLLAAGGSPAEEGAVEVSSWPAGERICRVTPHADVVYRVAWSPDGGRWATAGADSICLICDARTGNTLVRYGGHSRAVLSIAYLPDGGSVASAGLDHTVRLWNSETGEHLRTLDNHLGPVNDMAIRRVGSSVIAATVSEDRTVRLWQPEIGRLMRFARLPSPPRAVAWSKGGAEVLVGCSDGHLRTLRADSMAIEDDRDGHAGPIHELVIEPGETRTLVTGQAGCRVHEANP
jgi:WD40 repeat protein